MGAVVAVESANVGTVDVGAVEGVGDDNNGGGVLWREIRLFWRRILPRHSPK